MTELRPLTAVYWFPAVTPVEDHLMWDYYVGPRLEDIQDGVSYYKFVVHLRREGAINYQEIVDLLGDTVTILSKPKWFKIEISPLCKNSRHVYDTFIDFIEGKLGYGGYIDRGMGRQEGLGPLPYVGRA